MHVLQDLLHELAGEPPHFGFRLRNSFEFGVGDEFDARVVMNEAMAQLFAMIVNVLRNPLQNGQPDHVRRDDQRVMLLERCGGGGNEWMKIRSSNGANSGSWVYENCGL